MYKRKIAAALSALLAMAAVVAGCGGGGDGTEDTTSGSDSGGAAPTKAAFIKEADKICAAAEAELGEEITEYAEEHGIQISKEEPSEDEEVEIFEEVVLPNVAGQAEALAALTPPKGDEATVEDITDTLSAEVAEAEEDPGDLGSDTLAGASKKAQAYGLKSCGS